MLGGKARQTWRQPVHPEGRQDRKVQAAPRRIGPQGQRGARQGGQRPPRLGHEILRGGGQAQAVLVAYDQGHGQRPLKHLQLTADGALGQVQLFLLYTSRCV